MRYSFAKQYRLLKAEDFSSVFALRSRQVFGQVCVYRRDNGLSHARLGLVVGKKCAKKAVHRNTMKRCLREWFRQNRHRLPAHDLIIQVRQKFDKAEFGELAKKLQRLQVTK
ncbi:MAG: ribonuclease P protein component [Neisseriaceae bacterium]|nr:ribonuclease P protein component [Neisseriaceae bacterium]MBR5676490.1 ribonuclease P protein component [Neisseriaceae bacterium]